MYDGPLALNKLWDLVALWIFFEGFVESILC